MRKVSSRENPIAARSRLALISAADRLLEQRPAPEISIKDIVSAAGMSRPTFYQHFDGLGDLFAAAGLARLEAMFAAETSAAPPLNLTDRFLSLVTNMEASHQFLYHVYKSPGSAGFHKGAVRLTANWLRQFPELAAIPQEDSTLWEFLASGVIWTITKHLAERCNNPETPSEPPAADLNRIFEGFFV